MLVIILKFVTLYINKVLLIGFIYDLDIKFLQPINYERFISYSKLLKNEAILQC